MPWNQSDVVNERLKFVAAAQRGDSSMVELCRAFRISRKTGYKYLRRYAEEGPEGLRDRSRAPTRHPNRTSAEVEGLILRMRKRYPTWGSKKILERLGRNHFELQLPCRSTCDEILKRAGLVLPRKLRGERCKSEPPVVVADRPNDTWSIDFKGSFRVGDGQRCNPLTINDVYSRLSIECRALPRPKLESVQQRLRLAFRKHGLPKAMLSDNGPPFGCMHRIQLTRLGVWLVKLGVEPVFIQPGHPEQNGRHERFHRTLKADAISPPKQSLRAQQRAFDRFQVAYNEERPHEALGMRTPAEVYVASERRLPRRLRDWSYPEHFERRRVRQDGAIKWRTRFVHVTEAMAGELVGVEPKPEGRPVVWLCGYALGQLDERTNTLINMPVEGSD